MRPAQPLASGMRKRCARAAWAWQGRAGQRNYEPAWRTVGRKRHALTDGRLLARGWRLHRRPSRQPRRHRPSVSLAQALPLAGPLLCRSRLQSRAHRYAQNHCGRNRRTGSRTEGLRRSAQAVGDRAHTHLHKPLPQAGPRLRNNHVL